MFQTQPLDFIALQAIWTNGIVKGYETISGIHQTPKKHLLVSSNKDAAILVSFVASSDDASGTGFTMTYETGLIRRKKVCFKIY